MKVWEKVKDTENLKKLPEEEREVLEEYFSGAVEKAREDLEAEAKE